MNNNHYKDRSAFETIRLMKDFLLNNNIMVYEKWYINNGNMYSLSLMVDNTMITVNGKGVTKELALASAYGELAERLFAYVPFRMKNSWYNLDCKISQEEKNVSMDIAENLIKNYFSLIGKDSNTYNKFISQIMRFSQLKGNSKYQKTILFKNASDNTKLWLPIDFLDLLYGTNGMAAGNTIEEAMVQGLSEILERYVIRQCILKRLSPPELSQNLFNSLDNNKQIFESINAIEHSGRYSVKVRDLSLGAKIPAIGIILYDKVNRGYLVKVGVHPKLEIALERCFTELLQGHTIDNYRNIMLVRNCTKNPGDINNICRFYVDSHAHIPIEFFINEQVSYMPLTENNSFNNNIEMYKYLSEIIHQLGYEIFVHDYSKISIYSVQILVPGLSEYGAINDAYLDKVNEQYEVSRILLGGMKNYTYEQIKFLITFINKYIKSQTEPIASLILTIHLKKNSIYHKITIALFKFMLYLLIKDENGALEAIKSYNHLLRESGKEIRVYSCCEEYLTLKENYKSSEIDYFLKNYYTDEELSITKHLLDNDFVDELYAISCSYNCDGCKHNHVCGEVNYNEVYKKIRES